jgi:hypothetical protein
LLEKLLVDVGELGDTGVDVEVILLRSRRESKEEEEYKDDIVEVLLEVGEGEDLG